MALFDKKPKKLTLDEILKGIDGLTAEEKEKVHEKMQDGYKAEDEREIDKIEEDKAETKTEADEKGEEVNEESEEIGKDVDDVEEEIAEDKGETVEEEKEPEPEAEETEEAQEAEEKIDEHIQGDGEMKAWMQKVTDTLEELKQAIAGVKRQPQEVEKTEADKLDALAKKFE